jgi:hypothetical protein
MVTEENFQCRNILIFKRGAGLLNEWIQNPANDAAKTAPQMRIVQFVHPRAGPRSKKIIIDAIAANIRTVPSISK